MGYIVPDNLMLRLLYKQKGEGLMDTKENDKNLREQIFELLFQGYSFAMISEKIGITTAKIKAIL